MEDKITEYYEMACDLALAKVEQMARKILTERQELDEFVMCMGSYFFTYKSRKMLGDNLTRYTARMNSSGKYVVEHSEPFLKELNDFLSEWDDYLKLTGSPMRFTAKGEKITDW